MAKNEFAELFANGRSAIPEDILEQKGDVVVVFEDKVFPSVDGHDENLLNPDQLRRLTRGYVQEQRRKKVVKVPVYSDNGEFLKFKQEVQMVEGRIRIRRNSHDRSWYGKYPSEGKPRKWERILQVSKDVFEGHRYNELIAPVDPIYGGDAEWDSLSRVNGNCQNSNLFCDPKVRIALFLAVAEPK